MVSFAADALKRFVICNRIIQFDIQKRSIDPSPPPGLGDQNSRPECDVARFLPECEAREARSDRLRKQQRTQPDYICPRKNRISISRTSTSPLFRVGVSLRALFIRAHKDVQDFPRILPEIPGESVSTERSSEYRDRGGGEKEKERERDERRRIIAGLSESRDQRVVLAIFSDCYYPTGHFIALKSTYRATAILLPRSLNRTKSSLSER